MLIVALDAIATIGFAGALVVLISSPKRRVSDLSARYALATGFAIYTFINLSNALNNARITAVLDSWGDYIETLFFVLLAYSVYLVSMRLQQERADRMAWVGEAEHDMLMRIIDTTPTGIAVLDGQGRITFVNEFARHILGLSEHEAGSYLHTDGWESLDAQCAGPVLFAPAMRKEALRDYDCVIQGPRGQVKHIALSSTPVLAEDGSLSSVVVAFRLREALDRDIA